MADKSKTDFGFDQITNTTPEWANWIFRGWFIVSKAVVGFLGTLIAIKGIGMSITTYLVIIAVINMLGDPIMYGFSKLFGIVPETPDPNQAFISNKQIDKSGDTTAIKPVMVESKEATQPYLEEVPET